VAKSLNVGWDHINIVLYTFLINYWSEMDALDLKKESSKLEEYVNPSEPAHAIPVNQLQLIIEV
jgi:hypothetical protein